MTTPATPPAAARLFAKLDGVRVTSLPEYTPAAIEALTLHLLGFNVFPMPFAQKAGYPWKAVQYVRLAEDDIPALFRYRCNLAVMVGRTSGNLFVIDCETPAEFEHQRARLRAIGLTAWEVRTGGGGGHLYLRSAAGEVANLTLTKAKSLGLGDLEIRGSRCYVLAPPSAHPETGVFYQWLATSAGGPPVVPLAALDWLPLALASSLLRTPGERARAGYAETALAEEVERVASAPEGARNDTLNRAAFALGQLVAGGPGLDENEVWDALFDAALAAGLGKGEAARTIGSGLNAGMAHPRRASHTRAAAADQLRAWVSAQTWHGKAGASRRAVALALAERARTARNGTWRASVREVAELARVDKETACKALAYLTETGVIARAGEDATSSATVWKLGATVGKPDSAPPDNNSNVIRAFARAIAADAAKSSVAAAQGVFSLPQHTSGDCESPTAGCVFSLPQHAGALAELAESDARSDKSRTLSTMESISVRLLSLFPGTATPAESSAESSAESDISDPLSTMESISGSLLSLLPGTDAAERGALGKNGYLVYHALLVSDAAQRPAALAATCGLTVRQVRYALGVLKNAGSASGLALIERLPSGAWLANPVTDDWLDKTVAVRCGTAGAGEKRRARFERERQGRAAAAFAAAIAKQRRRDGHTS